MGSNLLIVTSGGGFGPVRGATATAQLTMDDVAAISDLPLIQHVAPESSTQAIPFRRQPYLDRAGQRTVPALQDIKDWPTRLGGFITEEDLTQGVW